MATFAKLLSCFSLIVLSICCHSQARESKFFFKYLHLSTNSYFTIPSTSPKVVPLSSPSPSPSPTSSGPDSASSPVPGPAFLGVGDAPAPAPTTLGADYSPAPAPTTLGVDYNPTPAPPENDIPYYGLYGKNNNNEEEEEEEEFSSADSNRETYTYSNGEPNSLSNNNGYWNSNDETYYNTNNGYDFDGGYKSDQPQGMSDTRLVDNSKYYNNVEREKYNPSVYDDKNDKEEGYYGNYESKYEFDSMEEYEKQERYADVQEEFIP